jgi:hypothetical protein
MLEKKILSRPEEEMLQWVKGKKEFIREMDSIIKSIESISVLLKHDGLSGQTAKACRSAMEQYKGFPRHLVFKRLFYCLFEGEPETGKPSKKILCMYIRCD